MRRQKQLKTRPLSDADQTRVLRIYQAARQSMERPQATIHVIRATGLPEEPVRAVIADYEFICEGDAA